MKAYTDLEQSKKLAEILPLESADMHYVLIDSEKDLYSAGLDKYIGVLPHHPAWSLTALLSIFPYYEINNNGVNIQLSVKGVALITKKGEHLLDLVVNMIIHLYELKML